MAKRRISATNRIIGITGKKNIRGKTTVLELKKKMKYLRLKVSIYYQTN